MAKKTMITFGTPLLNEFCCECGRSVRPGSGLFANRIPDGNSITVRAEMGRPYPEGDFVCCECDGVASDDWEEKLN